jgi:hypothetical protein
MATERAMRLAVKGPQQTAASPWDGIAARRAKARRVSALIVAAAAVGAYVLVGRDGSLGDGARAAAASPPARTAIANRTIRIRVLNATGVPLTVTADGNGGVASWRERPAGAEHLRVDDYTATGPVSVYGEVTYRIGTSGYQASITATNPGVGSNSSGCNIKTTVGNDAPSAPYTCEHKIASAAYNDANAYFVVQPRVPTTHTIDVHNARLRREALDAVCGLTGMEYESCGARNVDDVSYSTTPTEVVGDYAVNCGAPGTIFKAKISEKTTQGYTNSVGVNAETKLKLWTNAKLVLKASYSHTWSESHEELTTATLSIPSGYWGWLERGTAMQNVRADYQATAGNQTYVIPSVTVSAPAVNGAGLARMVAHAYPVPNRAAVCNGRDEGIRLTVPINPKAGLSYRIGISGANQYVISGGGTEGSKVRTAQSNGRALEQQWQFGAIPGYEAFQVRNVADPDLCLGTSEATGSNVINVACETGDSATLPRQLWTVVFDPDTAGYKLVSLNNGEAIVASEKSDGTTLTTSAHPPTLTGHWLFSHA